MKTIIARFTEVKQLFSEGMLTGEDSEGEEININKIDAALKTVGISLKDFLNGSKGIDDIFLELASKWDTLDLATQRYIATTAAGSRQQSRFLAMMGNYDRTMELVSAANNSAGASQEQFNKTLESLDAKLQRLKNAWAEFTMGLANNELIKFGVDLLTAFITVINKITEALPGATGNIAKLLLTIGGLKAGGAIFDTFFQNLKKVGPDAMGPF
jgi:TP901 family phage tail tape measure protein